jgi:hypothetical protein
MSIGYCPTCQAAPIIGDDYCPTCHRTGRTDAWVKSLPEYKPDAFGTRLSADGVNRLGDTIADLRMQVKEMVDTLRMAREALDNDEFALCAGMIDAAMKVGADKTPNASLSGASPLYGEASAGTQG